MKTLENIDITKPVQVYRNLHKPGCQFSVRQGGKVRCYVDSIVLTDCKFKHASTEAARLLSEPVPTGLPMDHRDDLRHC
jgi:hypothetical protein